METVDRILSGGSGGGHGAAAVFLCLILLMMIFIAAGVYLESKHVRNKRKKVLRVLIP